MATVAEGGWPRVAVADFEGMHAVTVVAPDRPGLLADIAGVLASFRLTVKSALVRTVQVGDGAAPVAVDSWWVDAGPGEVPLPATLETALRDLLD